MEDTGEMFDMYGHDPMGTALFTPQGRMTILICASGRPAPDGDAPAATVFRRMMAYAGKFRVEGDMIHNEVDVAWHPGWEGSSQPRHFTLSDNELTLMSPVQTHPMFGSRKLRGIVVWRREQSA